MSLTKKDPSFCVAANDPHLVSLGGGRLSTAVTIHNIPIGKFIHTHIWTDILILYNNKLKILYYKKILLLLDSTTPKTK